MRAPFTEGRALPRDADAETLAKAMAKVINARDARIAELEAERDRLREALEYIAEEHDAGRHDGKPEPCPAHSDYDMWLTARAALTPKPGDTDGD